MGMDDKLEHKAEDVQGKIKEGVGKATGDRSMETEGKAQQATADVKMAGEKVADAVKDATRR